MKRISVIILALLLVLTVCPAFSASADEQLATYSQDFSNLESVRNDFSAYSVYDLGTESEKDSIEADAKGKGYWYLNTDTDGSSQISRKNLEDGKPLDDDYGTKYIRILTFTRQKFVNFEMEVEFKRGTTTFYWAGVAIRQLNQGKYFLEDGAGIFTQQEGTTTLWGTDGVGGPHEESSIPGFKANDYHHLKVICDGLSLQVYIDGNLTMSRTLPRTFFRQGYVSLVSVNNESSFKNFKIKELPIERLPEEEQQKPIPEADAENSLTNLSKLPDAERLKVTFPKDKVDVWSILAIITGCTAILAGVGFSVLLILKKKSNKTNGNTKTKKE